jgi:hypothetical protein
MPALSRCAKKEAALYIACERLLPESVWFSISSATKIERCGILRFSCMSSLLNAINDNDDDIHSMQRALDENFFLCMGKG